MAQENTAGNWCLIESDPGVFSELIRGFGVSGVQVEELWSLDEDLFADLRPIYGLIFLFKWGAGEETSGELVPNAADVFFTQQVISNACASQALINLLLNTNTEDVQLGKILEQFRNFTSGFDPATRGLCLSNSEEIRTVHNSFAREHYLELEKEGKGSKEENYHFVTYVPVGEKIYELDGLREAPIVVGTVKSGEDWLTVVTPVINQRIQKYSAGEIHFNLMALVADKKMKSEKRLAELLQVEKTDEVTKEVVHLQDVIAEEEAKFQRYKIENARRRHNYTPFIVELLKILAKEGKLVPLVEKAMQDAADRKKDAAPTSNA